MYDYLIMLVPLVALVTTRDLSALWVPAILLSWAIPFSAAVTDKMIDSWGFGIQFAPIALAIAVVSLVRNAPEPLPAFVVPKPTL